jgi:hypothetical protein
MVINVQPFIELLENEYIRLALATGLVCFAGIAVWILLRRIKLWYWKTETVLDALDTISCRLDHVEGKLAAAEQDTFEISENIYAIGTITEEGKEFQQGIKRDIKNHHDVQIRINTGIAAMHEEIVEVHEEIAGVHELLADSLYSFQEASEEEMFDDDYHTDALKHFWQEDPAEDFSEEDEDEIRKKIRL